MIEAYSALVGSGVLWKTNGSKMTDEELDKARAVEAGRIYASGLNAIRGRLGGDTIASIAARLAREGWMPEDPLLKEAREIVITTCRASPESERMYRDGRFDGVSGGGVDIALAALRRGIELGKAER